MLRVVRRTDTEIKRLLQKAATAAEADVRNLAPTGTGKIVRIGQRSSASQAIRRTLRHLFADVGDVVRSGRVDAANAALLSAHEWEEPYYRAAGLPKRERDRLRAATVAMSERRVELMLRRFNTEQIPLSRQVYRTERLASGWVDEKINLGIGRGLDAREIAREVRDSIRPDVPGGVSYAAMRLGRTELNNAFHTAARVSSQDKPWVLGMEWHLSGSHGVPDVCDLLAESDDFGLGEGVYPPDKVPDKPHPHCFCFVTPELQDEDDFVAAFANGDYDSYFSDVPNTNTTDKVSIPPVKPKPKEGRAALAAAPLSLGSPELQRNGISGIDTERDLIAQYKGVYYTGINKYLRDGSGSFYRENVEKIDAALDRSRLTEDIIVGRGVKDPRSVFGDHIDGDLTGLEWIEDAYMSTSADSRVYEGFAERTKSKDGGLVLHMRVGKGAPMLRLSDFAPEGTIDSTSPEAELLGGRGWRLRITTDRGKDDRGLRHVDVEVVSYDRSGKDPWKR